MASNPVAWSGNAWESQTSHHHHLHAGVGWSRGAAQQVATVVSHGEIWVSDGYITNISQQEDNNGG